MKDVQNQNLAGFGCLGWGLLAIVAAPGIAGIVPLIVVGLSEPSNSLAYWLGALVIVLFYVPIFWLFKWAYSRRLKVCSSAADSLGLTLSRKFSFPFFLYSLEGEYKGYSIRVYQMSMIKGNHLMCILKCPESLRQRVKDGEIGGVVGTLQGKSRPWYAPPLPDGYEVFVEDGDFRFRQIGWFLDIASAVEQMADLVARLEDSPPPHLPEPPPDE